MAKFINKKEQVYDLKLTNYGHYLLSIGTFKPTYYTFLDDNIIYDKRYAMARRPHAIYTQVNDSTGSGAELGSKTLVLTDAASTQHTIEFKTPGSSGGPHYTTSDSAIVSDQTQWPTVTNLTTSYDIAVQVVRAVNSASAEGLIAMRAGEVFGGVVQGGWLDGTAVVGGTEGVTNTTASFGLTMDLTGTQGNAKNLGGTIISATPNLADATAFVGGFDPVIEPQNEVYNRIKNETQYLESFVLFRDLESGSFDQELIADEDVVHFQGDLTPTMMVPANDIFKFNGIIGDAYLEGDAQAVPSWKAVTLQGRISSSTAQDTINLENTLKIPQINIELNYTLDIQQETFDFDPPTLRSVVDSTPSFADNYVVALSSDDVMVYLEEVNTELLTENFDIEVFKILTGSVASEDEQGVYDTLERKYFRKLSNQVVNGFMRKERPGSTLVTQAGYESISTDETLDTSSVEYYFDVLVDAQVDQELACKGAQDFNRQSYYIDIDFDCDETSDEAFYYDIYGTATEPEICQD